MNARVMLAGLIGFVVALALTIAPSVHAAGVSNTSGNVTHTGTETFTGRLLCAPTAKTGAPVVSSGNFMNVAAATFTDTSTANSGTATQDAFVALQRPTLAASGTSVTTTDAATFYIANAPAAGTNQTITNPWALWVDAGAARFDGDMTVSGTLTASGLDCSGTRSWTGGDIGLNVSSNFAVNVATGTSTGTVTIGGSGTQSIAVGNGAGTKTVALGSATGTSTTTISSGSGAINLAGNGSAAKFDAVGFRLTMPATETIAGAAVVTADACGGLKRISAAAPVTTNTTNTFSAPAASNAGCCMDVVNVGANAITLDTNANFHSIGAADIVLDTNDAARVCSDGSAWFSTAGTANN